MSGHKIISNSIPIGKALIVKTLCVGREQQPPQVISATEQMKESILVRRFLRKTHSYNAFKQNDLYVFSNG